MHHSEDNSNTAGPVVNFFHSLLWVLFLATMPSAAQSVTLGWTDSDSPDVAGYKIYYGNASHDYSSSVAVGAVTSAAIPGLVAGKTYYCAVTTYDAVGNESDFSDEIILAVPAAVQPKSIPASNPALLMAAGPVPAASASNDPRPAATSDKTTEPLPVASANPQPEIIVKQPALPPAADTVMTDANLSASPKAKVVPPEKNSESKETDWPSSAPADAPSAPATNAPLAVEVKISAALDRARQFYAAVAPFDANADGRLDDDELAALMGAGQDDLKAMFVSEQLADQPAEAGPTEADVAAWCAASYALLAPFDANHDGELEPDELTAPAAAVNADNVVPQNFTPLPPAPGENQNADGEQVDSPAAPAPDSAGSSNCNAPVAANSLPDCPEKKRACSRDF